MGRLILSGVLISLIAIFPASGTATAQSIGDSVCPEGTLVFPGTTNCYPVVDRTGEFGIEATLPPRTLPRYQTEPAGGGEPSSSGVTGVTYAAGSVDASQGAMLQTGMAVYPTGLGTPLNGKFLFWTANNRTDLFLEVLAQYSDQFGPHIAVYDASCNPGEGVATETCDQPNQGYQITTPMSQLACYFIKEQDGQGRWHDMFYYSNFGVRMDASFNPDLWINEAQWFNRCTQTWDTVYSRQFQWDSENCAITGCSWWGPILETPGYTADFPIRELEYVNSNIFLWKAGQPIGPLVPPWTNFGGPPPALNLFHVTPNHTWAIGNFFDADGDDHLDNADNCLTWHNPTQSLPDWPVTALADFDCDGFGRLNEQFVGTWEADQCPKTAAADDEVKDAWPPDFNDNRIVNTIDTGRFVPVLNSTAPGPPYSQRFDLDANGIINTIDVGKMQPFLNKSCVPMG